MRTLITQRNRLAGFSLVELAIVLLITTILMSAGLGLLTLKREASQREATQKKQEAIKQALINYLGLNKRLPCPGIPTLVPSDGKEDRNTAAATPPCNRFFGIVPYQELGLDKTAVLDGWENFITYVVSPNTIAAVLPPATPSYTTSWLYSFSATINDSSHTPGSPLVIPNLAFWPSSSTGGITITDGTTNIADPTKATGAVVTLISYGKNGYGAFNVKGVQNDYLSAAVGDDEKQNADPAKLITPTTPPKATVVKRDTTDVTTGGGAFDDIVMMLSANDFTGPLIANGTLQSSAQAALSQANDAVIGNILALRTCNPTASCTQTTTTSSMCTSYVPGPTVCTDPPACTTYIPGPLVCGSSIPGTSGCSQYSSACSYSIPATASVTFAALPNVAVWGVSYNQVATTIYATTYLPITATSAYTLTAGDGSIKTVSIQELQGILARAAGFN